MIQNSGGVVPTALTFRKSADGYSLIEYEPAKDGGGFLSSIKEFSTYPESGEAISGLAKDIFNHYEDYSDLVELQLNNLYEHLQRNGMEEAFLINHQGETVHLSKE